MSEDLKIPTKKNEEFKRFNPTQDQMEVAYKWMWRSRYLNSHALTLQRNGKLYLWLSNKGQEASQIGVTMGVDDSDFIFPSYREHCIPLMRGVHIEELLARFSGKSNGGWNPRKHNCFIYTFILGSQVLHSTGYALAQKLENNADSRVTVVFFGDGASSQGAVHEGMVFAASYKTKQLFIIQDNGWAISTPTSRQSRVPLLHRAYGYGMGGLEVDGNSFIEVFSATKLLCERIRRGEGPQVLVLKTLRVDPHATSDAPQKYRNQHDYQQVFETIDPINKLKNQLITRGSDPAYLETLRDKARIHIKTLIDQSSKTCKGTW